jgi:HSP20 family protein
MDLTRFDPYREMQTLQDRLSRVFGNPGRGEREEEMSLSAWVPPVDIAEEKDRIVITAELPGFREDEISIQTENGMLTISGERKFEREKGGRNYHRVERAYGHFLRTFSLPNNVDRERIQATFQNGLLQIELPKREDARPRQIRVSGGSGATPGREKETVDVQSRDSSRREKDTVSAL